MITTQPNERRCSTTEESHILPLSPACPVSGNPQVGSSITITYTPAELILEVSSLRSYVDSYIGGRGEVRSMEGMVQAIAQDASNAIGVPVAVEADLIINPNQRMRLTCSAIARANGIGGEQFGIPEELESPKPDDGIQSKPFGAVWVACHVVRGVSCIGKTESDAVQGVRDAIDRAAKPTPPKPEGEKATSWEGNGIIWPDGRIELDYFHVKEWSSNYGPVTIEEWMRRYRPKCQIVKVFVSKESDLAAAREEAEKWRTKFLTQRDEANSNTWIWMGDGEDHPESLACPVIMSADQLRQFVASKESEQRLRAALEAEEEARIYEESLKDDPSNPFLIGPAEVKRRIANELRLAALAPASSGKGEG